jgi:AcrR family transcriptional regulator
MGGVSEDRSTAGASTGREALIEKAVAWFAENGVGDTSLRTLASGIGTSHRMLLYHFGSREGLLTSVMQTVEHTERRLLEDLKDSHSDPYEAGLLFWSHLADTATTYAPLHFELAGWAMADKPHAAGYRDWLATGWLHALTSLFELAHPADEAARIAELSLAMARGLLYQLAITGDRGSADRAMEAWIAMVDPGRRQPRAGRDCDPGDRR